MLVHPGFQKCSGQAEESSYGGIFACMRAQYYQGGALSYMLASAPLSSRVCYKGIIIKGYICFLNLAASSVTGRAVAPLAAAAVAAVETVTGTATAAVETVTGTATAAAAAAAARRSRGAGRHRTTPSRVAAPPTSRAPAGDFFAAARGGFIIFVCSAISSECKGYFHGFLLFFVDMQGLCFIVMKLLYFDIWFQESFLMPSATVA